MFGYTGLDVAIVTPLTDDELPSTKKVAADVPEPVAVTRISNRTNVVAARLTELTAHVAVEPLP